MAVHLRKPAPVNRHESDADTGTPPRRVVSPVVADMINRVADPDGWARWVRQVEHAGHCVRPVRLYGRAYAVDAATGEIRADYDSSREPDATLLVACKDRRTAVCPSCAATYQADTWHLVAAGLRGRPATEPPEAATVVAVPVSVVEHPVVFATFTAPSFGPVHHTTPDGQACRARRDRPRCVHGVPSSCSRVHTVDDPDVGTPLCHRCYDYTGHVLWHAHLPELWRRTVIYLYRVLAGLASERSGRPVNVRSVRRLLRVSYVKVAEWQKRAAIHLHAVIRLDGVNPDDPAAIIAPPPWADASLLGEAIREAAARVVVPLPVVEYRRRVAVWGNQLDIASVTVPERAAAYLAKYATKTAGDTLTHLPAFRFDATELPRLIRRGLPAHVGLLAATCFTLHRRKDCTGLRLADRVHTLGFNGHFATKTRHYSTTLRALRAARHAWRAANRDHSAAGDPWAAGDTVIVGDWRMVGIGFTRLGDVELAATLTRERNQAREHARDLAAFHPDNDQ